MHPLYAKAASLTEKIIGAALEVHRELGPGLMESYDERCLFHELRLQGLVCAQQKRVALTYKGLVIDEPLRFDLLVDECLLIEGKAVETLLPVHKAQILTYMKLLNVPLGLLINFNETLLKNGIHRLMLPRANKP
jgi:GxxExxY protein